jgi:hypothetical protein
MVLQHACITSVRRYGGAEFGACWIASSCYPGVRVLGYKCADCGLAGLKAAVPVCPPSTTDTMDVMEWNVDIVRLIPAVLLCCRLRSECAHDVIQYDGCDGIDS